MNNIHIAVGKRLFWGWLTVSLLIGGSVWWHGVQQIKQQVLEFASSEIRRVEPQILSLLNGTSQDIATLQGLANDYQAHGFVLIELYNRQSELVVKKSGVDSAQFEAALADQHPPTASVQKIRAEHKRVGKSRIIRVQVPLFEKEQLAGHFAGIYVVPDERLASLARQTRDSLLTAFIVVLATTLLLYPFIFSLNRKVHAEAHAILRGNMELMKVLGSAIAKRDSDTNSHNFRVTLYAVHLAEAIQMHKHTIKELIAGAFLHDVGKIGIHDAILLKPGPLNSEEFSIMKQHVALGLDIISHSVWLRHARDVVGNHHEWFDGSGYPNGLAGAAIPLAARVFAIADVFDALTSARPYKPPFSLEQSLEIVKDGAGTHFEPTLVQAFLPIAGELYTRFHQVSEKELEDDLQEVVLRYWNGGRE